MSLFNELKRRNVLRVALAYPCSFMAACTSRITNNETQDNAAAWVAGDDYLTFNGDEEINGEERTNIYIANLKNSEISKVTDRPGTIYFNGEQSPDGKHIVYAAFTMDETALRGERADIYVVERPDQ